MTTAAAANGWEVILVFCTGLVLGSFLNVVAYRVPRGESLAWPGSHCLNCNRSLSAWELVPIVSWLLLQGRCRGCRRPIPLRYPILELVTGCLAAATWLTVPDWPQRIAWGVFWLLLVAVTGTDLTAMRVPNVLSYTGAVVLVVLSPLEGVQSWRTALIGGSLCFLVLLVIHFITGGNMGLGDAKLYFSIGAMFGAAYGMESFVLASCSGAVVGLLMRWAGLMRRREYMPFVPHIAIGVVLTKFFGPAMTEWYLHLLLGH
ncbi:prepilin peptidase [Alicyclobacillus tolerans]|uniref:prepilin peptidase n=1 Tax=Alicyclobacillus tolerans TaxID=90970 RepID=UPI001F34DEF2|nr:A24 family peptidase [Alicyclobacillus tolerans]MCF8563547.1 prepilin peptidase [Alicyclobacillus tolerans]